MKRNLNNENIKQTFYDSGKIKQEMYFCDDVYHRDDGPAVTWYEEYGTQWSEQYWIHGKRHRDDGPATIWYRGSYMSDYEYFKNGVKHRDDGPASGCLCWGNTDEGSYWFNGTELIGLSVNRYVSLIECSENKTETILQILKDEKNIEHRNFLGKFLAHKFGNELHSLVSNNIDMLL